MWYKINGNEIILNIYAKPQAKKTAIVKIAGDQLHIAIHAKPLDGEANKELISFLAKTFEVPKSQIILQRGEHSRYKTVMLPFCEKIILCLNKTDKDYMASD